MDDNSPAMASKVAEEAPHSESEGENRALRIKKKINRRVSFADTEITSVHFFRRDDECETPPDSKPSSRGADADAGAQPENEVLGFFRDLGGDSDESGEDEEGSVDRRKSFLRPMGSPSPGGSSTAGSAASNDEDNFFGPVSSSFIRPGRLSDSGVSDDIHEETLDTTAFSLHYRSLARSESEVKTPTAVRLVFEDKTATKDSNPTGSGSLMAITEPKKLNSQSLVPLVKVRGGEDSDDMSIVDETPNKYNYGTLSPTLDALLEEGSKDLNAHSVDILMGSKSPMRIEVLMSDHNGVGQMDQSNGRDSKLGYTRENSAEADFISNAKLSEKNGGPANLVAFNNLTKGNKGLSPGASNHDMQSPNHLLSGHKRFTTDATVEKVVARLECPTTRSGGQPNVDGKAHQFDVGAQHESAYQHFNESSVQESSPRIGQLGMNAVPDQRQGSPLEASAILSSARRQQPILSTPNSARGSYIVSPLSKQADLQSEEPMKHVGSVSRFKIPDHSYAGSNIKQGTDKLIRRLSKYSSITSPFGSALDHNNTLLSEYLGTPDTGPSEQLFNADLKNEEDRSLVSLDVNQLDQVKTPRSSSRLGQKESPVLAKDGDPLHLMSVDNILKDKPNTPSATQLSPFRLTLSGIKVMRHSLISEGSTKNMLFTSIADSVLVDDKAIDLPLTHIESGTSRPVQFPVDKANLNFQLGSPEKEHQTIKTTLLSTSYSPQSKESTQSLFKRAEAQNYQGETPSQKAAWELMDVSSRIKLTERSPKKLRTASPLTKEPTSSSFKKTVAQSSLGKEPLQSPHVKELTGSPRGNKTNQSPSRKDQTVSPYRLDQSNATHGGNMLSYLRKDVASPRSISSRDGSDNLNQKDSTESPLSTKEVEITFARKRGSAAVVLEDGKFTHKSPRIQKNPDVLKIGNSDFELLSYQVNKVVNETDKSECNRTQKHWLSVFEKFSRDTEQCLSPSINVLNFKAIGTLEDILSYSLKAMNYEMLGSEIQSQKAADHSVHRHKKRIAETSLLICKIAHEKAKLQLLKAKHEKLLKKVHILKSGIQECQLFKLNVQQSKIGERDAQHGDCGLQSHSVNLETEHQVPKRTADTMKQEIKVLDGKINSLSNLFQSYCKLKGEPSYADTLASIQDLLLRRKCCRLIRQDLQLWSIDGFQCQNGVYNILLNYQGYLSQRFTLTSGSVSSIISIQLNDKKVLKVFPNMDALVAFAFVFNAEATKRGVVLKRLGQATQATNSLICNLLDIVEEVQMAQIEIENLVQANFHSPSGQQLSLQLCFTNFHTGAKVTLNLDVTCLKSGTYPIEILPYEVQVPLVRAEKSKSLLDAITYGAENLEVGCLRIVRLCRCVSQLLQASNT